MGTFNNDDGEDDDARERERDLFDRARIQTFLLLENVTPFLGGVVFRVFTHLFFSLSL